jgi:protein transport protein SEC24
VQTHSAFGPALQCIFLIMNGIGGKLLVFQSAPPSVGVGESFA